MLDLTFFSDEANCHLSVHVNKENMQFWAEAQPHEYAECSLSQKKVTVWCATGQQEIIGPYFFEDGNGRPVTVDTD